MKILLTFSILLFYMDSVVTQRDPQLDAAMACMPLWFLDEMQQQPTEQRPPRTDEKGNKATKDKGRDNVRSGRHQRPKRDGGDALDNPWDRLSEIPQELAGLTQQMEAKKGQLKQGRLQRGRSMTCGNYTEVLECLEEAQEIPGIEMPRQGNRVIREMAQEYTEICRYLNCELPLYTECVEPTVSLMLQLDLDSEDDMTHLCSGLERVMECAERNQEACHIYPSSESVREFEEIIGLYQWQCHSFECGLYFRTCPTLRKLHDLYGFEVFGGGACLMCDSLAGVTECFADMPEECYCSMNGALMEMAPGLVVEEIWSQELINFLRHMLAFYFDVDKCKGCIEEFLYCYYNVNQEDILEGCGAVAEMGQCMAKVVLSCDAIWQPTQQVIAAIIDDVTQALSLLCHAMYYWDDCTEEQANCIFFESFFDMLFSLPVMSMEYLGLDIEQLLFGGLVFRQASAKQEMNARVKGMHFRGSSLWRDRDEEGSGFNVTWLDEVCMSNYVEIPGCLRYAFDQHCTEPYHLDLSDEVHALNHINQFLCWFFSGDYSLYELHGHPWFQSLSSQDIDDIRSFMAAPPVTHIAESSTQPQEPEPYVPPPQVSSDEVVAMRMKIQKEYNPAYSNPSHPITLQAKRDIAHALYEQLHQSVMNLQSVNVTHLFRGSVGVDYNLIMPYALSATAQSEVTSQVAYSFRQNEGHFSLDGVVYDVTDVAVAVAGEDGEAELVPLDGDLESVTCAIYDSTHFCGIGMCEVVMGRPVCRCPDGRLAYTCHPPTTTTTARPRHPRDSDESHDSGSSEEAGDDLGVVLAAMALGVIVAMLLLAVILIGFYRRHQTNEERRAKKQQVNASLRESMRTHSQLSLFRPQSTPTPVFINAQSIPVIQQPDLGEQGSTFMWLNAN